MSSNRPIGIPNNGRFMYDFAYVYIPSDVDRESYIKYCVDNNTVAIRSTYNGTYIDKKAMVPPYLMGHIQFPEGNENGSLVLYIKTDKKLVTVVVHVLTQINQRGHTNNENHHRIFSKTETGESEISINGNTFYAKADGDNSVVYIYSTGSKGKIKFLADKEITLQVKRGNSDVYSEMGYRDGKFVILQKGDESEAESGVLGDTLKEKINEICDEISSMAQTLSTMTIASPFGPLGPPVQAEDFANNQIKIEQIKQSLDEILSKNYIVD